MTEKKKSIAYNYFTKCQYLLNANSNLKKEIIALKFENADLKQENEQLKIRFKEERDTTMKLGRECDNLTIKNQKLELEIVRLKTIIKTGDDDDCNRTS